MSAAPPFAYVFERFPSFTQTFCVREVMELERQGIRPLLFSIRDTREEMPRHFPPDLYERVIFLPAEKEMVEEVKEWKRRNELPQAIVLTLRHWGERPDKMRVYEAAWIGRELTKRGVTHVHSHFAGIGARTCWWLQEFFDVTYSFTGHANDLFCKVDFDLTLDRLMSAASLVVTVSDYTVADLQRRFPASASKIRRVYNGLDLAPFQEAARHREHEAVWNPPDGALILSVGRLIEKKGFDDLIRACAVMERSGRVRDFRCVIVGEGPMEEELRSLASSLDIAHRITLAGPKSQPEIAELLSQTALFALPCVTEHDGGKDNLPTVLMEAMAARVACASTILAGIPEMVQDGVTGRLAEERQPEIFGELMADLLSQPGKTDAMGAAGELRAITLFAKEKTARQLFRLLAAHGLVRVPLPILVGDPVLIWGCLRQAMLRLRRLFRFGARSNPLEKQGIPDGTGA